MWDTDFYWMILVCLLSFKELSRAVIRCFFYRSDDNTKMQPFTALENRAIRHVCIELPANPCRGIPYMVMLTTTRTKS